MLAKLNKARFGPWAVITGASSGIGREFARQIAASGINLVLVARREALLQEAGAEFSKAYGVEHRIIVADLSEEDFLSRLTSATGDLDIGLVISNAGSAYPGEFLGLDRGELVRLFNLNSLAHMQIAHHFGPGLVQRRRGGILLCGAMGAVQGVPYMANESGAKSYVQSFGEALHVELSPLGVSVSVLIIGPTQTAIIKKLVSIPRRCP